MFKPLTTALIAIAAFAGTAQAQTQVTGPTPGPRSGERADIPFATHNGIRSFRPTNDGSGVYLQDNRRNWYYATFFSRCIELPYAFGVGFRTFGGSSTLSRGDTILTERDSCRIADIVRSGPPPEKPRRARRQRAPHRG